MQGTGFGGIGLSAGQSGGTPSGQVVVVVGGRVVGVGVVVTGRVVGLVVGPVTVTGPGPAGAATWAPGPSAGAGLDGSVTAPPSVTYSSTYCVPTATGSAPPETVDDGSAATTGAADPAGRG